MRRGLLVVSCMQIVYGRVVWIVSDLRRWCVSPSVSACVLSSLYKYGIELMEKVWPTGRENNVASVGAKGESRQSLCVLPW